MALGGNRGGGPDGIRSIRVATLHDTNPLPDGICRWICILSAGALKITDGEGSDQTIPTGLAVGVWHPIWARRIWSTGTTVTPANILVGY